MQSEIQVRFYEELNDYLPSDRRKRSFAETVNEGATVQELLAQLGVPRSEVDLVLVNGESVPFSRMLVRGDRVSVYPVFESFDIKPVACLREEPLRCTRFIVDRDLGLLGAHLRHLGFDVIEVSTRNLTALVETAEREKRVVLTKSPSAIHGPVSRLYGVKAQDPKRQLAEVIRRFDLQRESAGGSPGLFGGSF
jgi:uncharacterized protein